MSVEPDFLPTEPPPLVARALSTTLLVIAATALAGSIVVRVPETVTGPLVLVPDRGADPVRAPREGLVVRTSVFDARAVEAGDTLYELASEPAGARGAERQLLEATLSSLPKARRDLLDQEQAYRQADSAEASRLTSRIATLDRSIVEKQRQLAILRDLESRARPGVNTGVATASEMANLALSTSRASDELSLLEGDREQTLAARARLRFDTEARSADLRDRLRRLDLETRDASSRLTALRAAGASSGATLAITSPCRGTLLHASIQRVGAVVQQGEALADIACAGGRVRAEVTLPSNGIARVRTGQSVRLLYTAFPYQRHGVRFGEVVWVGPTGTSTARGDSSRFRALVAIDDSTIVVDGSPQPLTPGMDGTARIVVEKRRLITYAFAPLRQLREAMADRPSRPATGLR